MTIAPSIIVIIMTIVKYQIIKYNEINRIEEEKKMRGRMGIDRLQSFLGNVKSFRRNDLFLNQQTSHLQCYLR